MSKSPLRELQERYGPALDASIEEYLRQAGDLDHFVGMMRYQLGWVNRRLQTETLDHGGKRFRSVACLLACQAVGGRWEEALHVAAAIELLHNFSLIHDDIEDHDPARRHRPTVWKVWGEPQAINAGDAMFSVAWAALLNSTKNHVLELARAFTRTCLSLTQGQHLDMSFEERDDVTADEYLHMISLKTGALISYSLSAGALSGGADTQTQRELAAFGLELGRAYQIRDDVMGIWAGELATGKEPVKDLHNRKKTLPVLLAAERADERQGDILKTFFQKGGSDVEAVIRVLRDTDARSLSIERMHTHVRAAGAALSAARVMEPWRSELGALADDLTAA